jgi:radical SAM superfamily enzyme
MIVDKGNEVKKESKRKRKIARKIQEQYKRMQKRWSDPSLARYFYP